MYKKIIRNLKLDIYLENKSIYTDIYDKIISSLNELNCYIGAEYKNIDGYSSNLDGWKFYGNDTNNILIDVHMFGDDLKISEQYFEQYIKDYCISKYPKYPKIELKHIVLSIITEIFETKEEVEYRAMFADSLKPIVKIS